MEAAIWGFIGTIVGALASILTTFLVSWNNRWLQSDANKFKREEKRKEFQRTTLMQLQDAVMSAIRLAVRVHIEDTHYYRNNPDTDRPGLLPEELSNELMLSIQELNRLIERVDDDSLRINLKNLRIKICEIQRSTSESHSHALVQDANTAFGVVQEEIGAILRQNQ